MAAKKKLLEQMEANPAKGWSMREIEALYNQVGLTHKPPSNGSHDKVLSDLLYASHL